jgi:two-component system, NarL family, sensor histidine kinase UhpB
MKPVYAVIFLVLVVIFVAELSTPLGVDEWLGYFLTVLIVSRRLSSRELVLLSSVISVLIWIAFLYAPEGIHPDIALINRLGAILVLWITTILLVREKRVDDALERSRRDLRAFARHLEDVREEESKRISREIHDELGQGLTAARFELAGLQQVLPEDAVQARGKAEALSGLLSRIIEDVRRISRNLRPAILDDFGLRVGIEWCAQEFQARTGIDCEVHIETEELPVDDETVTAVFRIFQEALTNVAKHSGASHVTARLFRRGDNLGMVVEDNGKGIEPKPFTGRSFGLLGMRERALRLGGRLDIGRRDDKGTCLTLSVPLSRQNQ